MRKQSLTLALAACLAAAPSLAAQSNSGASRLPQSDAGLYGDAARVAWTYVEKQTQPESGFVNSVINYPYATVWDIGSGIAALYCAGELGLVDRTEYDRRMRLVLKTLRETGMYDNGGFNKNYSTRTGKMAGRNNAESSQADKGYGWSALDTGRLLTWLRIVEVNQPQYRDDVEAIVHRLDFRRMVADGYLRGEDVSPRGGRARAYQEGKLGYEQYSATGYALWGQRADRALSLSANTRPITVMGVPLVADNRGGRLTSEPFILMGLETGWTPEQRELAWRVLAAQEARFRQTGTVTIVSEDALNRPPYFLYYSVWSDGREFAVEPPEGAPPGDTPRTVSTKAAFGWHALLPSSYTLKGVQTVAAARTSNGWGAGVFEADARISGGENVNTAAIVLESALYVKRGGRPLIEPVAPPAAPAAAAR
ncbi:MAG TPA: DUF3131 domain-containing protein [Longimicrobiaceae bacterium]|nr:DUF3131 domain-containing protein [Longimicrobiaceae bacterium]